MKIGVSPCIVVTVNAEAIVRAHSEPRLHRIIDKNLATIDGQIPLWLYHHAYKGTKIEKLSGSDLIYDICEWASKNHLKVFLLGGNQQSNEESVKNLKKRYDGLNITGFSPIYQSYPFTDTHNENILKQLRQRAPDILFVGFGMGKQEYWAEDHLDHLEDMGVKLIIGCGGTFDFVSGRIKRAPKRIQDMGLEGFWRLASEFKWFRVKRILVSLKIFLLYFKYHILSKSRENKNIE